MDLSKLESDSIATVEMGFRLKDQSFQALKDITLRNRVVVNKEIEEIYKNVKVTRRDGRKEEQNKASI